MNLYFAPMEGVTGFLFRNVHHEVYPGIDKYFTPFVSPGAEKGLGAHGRRDVLPENNRGIPLVPQILTNRADIFLRTAKLFHEEYGYAEVNLNLGCPSPTVVPKGKGAGFLSYPDDLERFFDRIFSDETVSSGKLLISVKTRIGKTSPEEWPRLMEIYNRFPLSELIVHPRIQTDMYRNHPDLSVFSSALAESRNPLVYNGDIFSVSAMDRFRERFPSVDTVMLGRGLLYDPGLAERLTQSSGRDADNEKVRYAKLKKFHDRLLEEYCGFLSGDRQVLAKMKEVWAYMIIRFPDAGKLEKKLKKSTRLAEYRETVDALFESVRI